MDRKGFLTRTLGAVASFFVAGQIPIGEAPKEPIFPVRGVFANQSPRDFPFKRAAPIEFDPTTWHDQYTLGFKVSQRIIEEDLYGTKK